MRLFQRGSNGVWWYDFQLKNKLVRRSSRSKNRKIAQEIAAAKYSQMLRIEAGLEAPEAAQITLRQFEKKFVAWVNSTHDDHPRSREFYHICYQRLLEFPELADCQVSRIDSALVEKYKTYMIHWRPIKGKTVGKTSINRYLATLRKTLHYMCDVLNLIPRVPKIVMFPKSSTCERQREYIFDNAEFEHWLNEAGPELRDASILARECGICENEILALQRDCVSIYDEAEGDLWGTIEVKRGLKRDARLRTLSVTPKMREILLRRMKRSECEYVFTAVEDPTHPLSHYTLSGQARDLKRRVKFHKDAGLHALRHTYLTEMGRVTDVWTLMRLAGHSSITTTQRYVHPEADAMTEAAQLRIDRQRAAEVASVSVSTKTRTENITEEIVFNVNT